MAHKILRLRVMNRGLVDVPIKNDSKRARNWCATVKPDPNAPGGLTRHFWQQGRGDFFHYIIPESLDLLDVIEFGADQMRYSGNGREPNRLYGVIVGYVENELTVASMDVAVAALALADDLKAERAAERAKAQVAPGPADETKT